MTNYKRVNEDVLKEAIYAVIENNEINDGKWSDWEDAYHILDTYNLKPSKGVVEILDRAIESNGNSLAEDVKKTSIAIWGVLFAGGGSLYNAVLIEEEN